jgi:hypothetical protein
MAEVVCLVETRRWLANESRRTLPAELASSCLEWLLGYGDGWSGIEAALQKRYGDVLVRLQLPLRNYLIVETSPEGLRSIQRPSEVFVGPSLIARRTGRCWL